MKSYREELALVFERYAKLRSEQVKQHPEDDVFYILAAVILDDLALQARDSDYDRRLFGRYCDLAYCDDVTSVVLTIEMFELLREVGFQFVPGSLDCFLEKLLERAKHAAWRRVRTL